VDASNHIYQYLAVVGRMGDQMLSNEAGETTSHLQGMFYRTVRMLEAGIQPAYVFDGRAPELKKATLAGRREAKEDATEALAAAKEAGNAEDIEKYSKRSVRVTKEHNDDCKKLLALLGVPVIEAPSEAEAQCSVMAKVG
jgi:flap endonuclease-1